MEKRYPRILYWTEREWIGEDKTAYNCFDEPVDGCKENTIRQMDNCRFKYAEGDILYIMYSDKSASDIYMLYKCEIEEFLELNEREREMDWPGVMLLRRLESYGRLPYSMLVKKGMKQYSSSGLRSLNGQYIKDENVLNFIENYPPFKLKKE